jgi:hypothetical protein
MRSYRKNCRKCGNRIEMQETPWGRWIALDLSGARHVCPPPRPVFDTPVPNRGLDRAEIQHLIQDVITRVNGDLVRHHDFVVRVEIRQCVQTLSYRLAVCPRDEPANGALGDVRKALYFDRTDTPVSIKRRIDHWFGGGSPQPRVARERAAVYGYA